MPLKHLIELYDKLDSSKINMEEIVDYFKNIYEDFEIETYVLMGENGFTNMIKILIPGINGKRNGGNAKTLAILGRLGGIGARPNVIGFVSDGDGALAVLATAAKILSMKSKGDHLNGDIYISTHICTHAPTVPHEPVDFMGSPVNISQINEEELVNSRVKIDGVLSVDTTKGNRIYNKKGFAITPTVKEGYILRVSEDLLDIMEWVTGELPGVLPITTQDITPYGNDIYHINSILQPSVVTDLPTVGIAITTETIVPGCMTGSSHIMDIETTAKYLVEVSKAFGNNKCNLYDEEEFEKLKNKYGSLKKLQTI
ncbi:DUF1177 domain-containing protein [Miniphocaeibacter halophilus]|uniref:DUF1177 domain-containing protein n=1 Tax=Miniphocaeibacter halophilus TaxID=2931922 RepID=A0AC61MVC0_9FIRM|nr:DUF1177 domain-containing protein [Miniphocaeibacter halophilus]QQK08355.1 DUF1177 domain-containing protein [Miniphocaeibacter halophilus]